MADIGFVDLFSLVIVNRHQKKDQTKDMYSDILITDVIVSAN